MSAQVASLPFAEDQDRATVERMRRLFTSLAGHAATVGAAVDSGAVTPGEALAVLRRHVRRFQAGVVVLEHVHGSVDGGDDARR